MLNSLGKVVMLAEPEELVMEYDHTMEPFFYHYAATLVVVYTG